MSQTNVSIFEQAARIKLRFQTTRGTLTVEDLFDLPLSSDTKTNLDDIAKELHKRVKEDEVSFVKPVEASKSEDNLRFEIVKRVIAVRIEERDARARRQASKERRQRILEALEQKKGQALSEASIEDLEKMLAEEDVA